MTRSVVSVELEVPFHDVDSLQIVWHGHYYKYIEIARTALMRHVGLDNHEIMRLGHGLVMGETQCKHTGVLRYGDRVRVDAWFKDYTQRLCIAYEVRNLTSGKRRAGAYRAGHAQRARRAEPRDPAGRGGEDRSGDRASFH